MQYRHLNLIVFRSLTFTVFSHEDRQSKDGLDNCVSALLSKMHISNRGMGTRIGTERQGHEQRNRDREIETQKKEQGQSERDTIVQWDRHSRTRKKGIGLDQDLQKDRNRETGTKGEGWRYRKK